MTPISLGIDAGGTSVHAVAVDTDGEVIFEGRGGAGNWASTDPDLLEANIASAIAGAPKPDKVALCMAGLLTSDDFRQADELIQRVWPEARVLALPDWRAPLALVDEDPALVVISGTGSLIASRKQDAYHKSGGGGPLIGDEGSAFRFGRLIFSHMDEIPAQILEQTGQTNRDEVIAWVYRQPRPAAAIASFAPLFAELAENEPLLREAIYREFTFLSARIHLHGYRFVSAEFNVVHLAGGLWDCHPLFKEVFCESIGPYWSVKTLAASPVFGAVRLAQQL